MDESIKRTSIKAKLFRKISKNLSDYCIYLCSTTDFSNLPLSVKQNGSKTYITITGTNIPAIESIETQYFGEWVTNKKYGTQFKADSYKFVTPTTEKGIKAFLKSKAFPGIGPKTADAIVTEFGKNTMDVIKNAPNKLLTVPGISPTKLGLIISAYKKNEAFSNTAIFLSTYGIPSDSIIKINDKFGDSAVETIKANPYSVQEIKGIGFKTSDKIARGLSIALDSYERIRGGILEAIKSHMLSTGDTCIDVYSLEKKTLALLNEGIEPPPVSDTLFKSVMKKLHESKEIVFRSKTLVLLKEYDEAEDYSSKKLLKMLKNKAEGGLLVSSCVNEFKRSADIPISNSQAEAITMALSNRVSVITGGPGTGKTTILSAVIDCYKKLYKREVVLLAPTGKAARRMTEASGYPASTIHSRIGIFDSGVNHSMSNLPNGLIVIDEASMVDTILLYKFLKAVPDDAHLLFIGDVNQLPSVSSGAVLSDIIKSGAIPVHKLVEIFRQKSGGVIASNAKAINDGLSALSYDEDFRLIEVANEEAALPEIEKVYKEEVATYGVDNVALLSPLRRSQNGRFSVVAEELNSELQNAINPKVAGKFCILYNQEYREGDRVLQWKNTEACSNGDIGEIMSIADKDGDVSINIHWDNGNDTNETRQSMADISLAYAISIHKSQGSEYKSVIIPVLSSQRCKIMRRNLLYTATTRSKEHVIYVGDKDAINYCISHCDADSRVTLFKERLKAYSKQC